MAGNLPDDPVGGRIINISGAWNPNVHSLELLIHLYSLTCLCEASHNLASISSHLYPTTGLQKLLESRNKLLFLSLAWIQALYCIQEMGYPELNGVLHTPVFLLQACHAAQGHRQAGPQNPSDV